MNYSKLQASMQAAKEQPLQALFDLYSARGMRPHIEAILNGASPFTAFGREGEAPAGFLSRVDAIETATGTTGGRTTLDGQDINTIWNEMQAMLSAFNASASSVVSSLTFNVTMANEKIGVPTSPGFQVATEYGRPSKIRMSYIGRGFPIEHYDLGEGYTQEFIDEAQGAQLLAVQATAVNAWETLRRELVLAALFGNTNYTDKDGIAVKRLYNADGEVPPAIKRWTHSGTHTHYLTSGGATFTQANLDTMSEHLIHHGFREYGDATFVLRAHRDDVATFRGFANWIPAETSNRPAELANSGVVRGRQGGGAGQTVQGYVNDWSVVEDNDIPVGYALGIASGGAFNPRNPVGLRSHSNPSINGLRLHPKRENYPLIDSVYDGYLGAGVGQRGASVVMQETAGAYAVPTFATGE